MANSMWGIDFGACNIKISQCFNGKVRPFKLNTIQGEGNQLSNIVYYGQELNGKHEVLFGRTALNKNDAVNTVRNIKAKFVLPEWKVNIPNLGKDITANKVVTDIFVKLANQIHEKRDDQGAMLPAVLTVPVSFSSIQKTQLRNIATNAGFDVKQIITEPFAALFAEEDFSENLQHTETVFVYDFGGSTLDISVVTLSRCEGKVSVEEKAAAGMFFGGLDIDNDILIHIVKKNYEDEWKTIVGTDGENVAMSQFLLAIEKAKSDLFDDDTEKSDLFYTSNVSGKLFSFTLYRQDIEKMFSDLKYDKKIVDLLDKLFAERDDLRKEDITQVRIYGGSCKINYFLKILTEYFGTEVFDYENYDLDDDIYMGVSAGAARYLQIISDKSNKFIIHNVIPFDIGLKNNKKKFVGLINRNEWYGLEKPKKLVKKFIYDDSNLIFYQKLQSFVSGQNNGLTYVGSLPVDGKVVGGLDGLMFTVTMREDDSLLVKYYRQQNVGEEPKEVDCAVLQLGG